MITDSTKLRGLLIVLGLIGTFIVLYMTYLILNHIKATEYMYFVFFFYIVFTLIYSFGRTTIDNTSARIKALEERIRRLEGK